jgi:hypothetical protein
LEKRKQEAHKSTKKGPYICNAQKKLLKQLMIERKYLSRIGEEL